MHQNESQNRMEMVFTYDRIRCVYSDSRFRLAFSFRLCEWRKLWSESERQLEQFVCKFLEKGKYMRKSKLPNTRERIMELSRSFCHSFAFVHSFFLSFTHTIFPWLWVFFYILWIISIRYRSVCTWLHFGFVYVTLWANRVNFIHFSLFHSFFFQYRFFRSLRCVFGVCFLCVCVFHFIECWSKRWIDAD